MTSEGRGLACKQGDIVLCCVKRLLIVQVYWCVAILYTYKTSGIAYRKG